MNDQSYITLDLIYLNVITYNLNYAPTTLGVQSWVEKCL
jgi:hypothetical protein